MSKRIIVTCLVILLLVVGLTAVAAPVKANGPTWDKSSLSVNGVCTATGETFTVSNTGSGAMAGSSTWTVSLNGSQVGSGTIPALGIGGSWSISFTYSGQVEFRAYQRPGHPGLGYAKSRITCTPPPPVTTPAPTQEPTEQATTPAPTQEPTDEPTLTATTPAPTQEPTEQATTPAPTEQPTQPATQPPTQPPQSTVQPTAAPQDNPDHWTGLCTFGVATSDWWITWNDGTLYGNKPWGPAGSGMWFGGIPSEVNGQTFQLHDGAKVTVFTVKLSDGNKAECGTGSAPVQEVPATGSDETPTGVNYLPYILVVVFAAVGGFFAFRYAFVGRATK